MLDLMEIFALDAETVRHGYYYQDLEGSKWGYFPDGYSKLYETGTEFNVIEFHSYSEGVGVPLTVATKLPELAPAVKYKTIGDAAYIARGHYSGNKDIRYFDPALNAAELNPIEVQGLIDVYGGVSNYNRMLQLHSNTPEMRKRFDSMLSPALCKQIRNTPVLIMDVEEMKALNSVCASGNKFIMAVVCYRTTNVLVVSYEALNKLHDGALDGMVEHELVHIDQIHRGDLVVHNDAIYWKGEHIPGNKPEVGATLHDVFIAEIKLPWEREAYGRTLPVMAYAESHNATLRNLIADAVTEWQGIDPREL